MKRSIRWFQVETLPFTNVGLRSIWTFALQEAKKGPLPAAQLEAIFDASGVSCEVLVGGPLNVGEQVTAASKWSPGQATVRDVGTQPPGYYIRPSKRSAAMARGAAQQMSTTLEELLTTDPNGVARVEAAYNSIGLGFWP